jgi:hypothetical protein
MLGGRGSYLGAIWCPALDAVLLRENTAARELRYVRFADCTQRCCVTHIPKSPNWSLGAKTSPKSLSQGSFTVYFPQGCCRYPNSMINVPGPFNRRLLPRWRIPRLAMAEDFFHVLGDLRVMKTLSPRRLRDWG